MFRRSFFAITIFMTVMVIASMGKIPAVAQDGEPPLRLESPTRVKDPDHGQDRDGLQRGPEGNWYMPDGGTRSKDEISSPLDTGGPDDFGYTWDDSVTLDWVDVTGGAATGLVGDSRNQATDAIPLPFPFKYYENTYTQVYISAAGYLAFTEADYWDDQDVIPSPREPNNVVAPYWTPTYIGPGGWVRYLSGGTAPTRYFAVEWHDVRGGEPGDTIGDDETYRFEVILYEYGDIRFQYQTMDLNDDWWCGDIGIEDSAGLDGLSYVDFCDTPPSDKAVHIYRPPPMARVSLSPPFQGRFTRAGERVPFELLIRNTGELGSDTYDLSVSSGWSVDLFAADGVTPFIDTDLDGTIDTGPVAQGGSTVVVLKVTTPTIVNVGDNNSAVITVRSSLNMGQSKSATIKTAVPAPFVQVYEDDENGAMSLYLAQPHGQVVKKATADRYYGDYLAVTETPGFIYAWTVYDWLGEFGVREIAYTLLNDQGNAIRAVTKLTDHSGGTLRTYDYDPAVAVAPNGNIGLLWYRNQYNNDTNQSNYNIWFAVLNGAGDLVYGPANITQNNLWGAWNDTGVPRFWDPRITATGDNRFVLAWHRESYENDGWLDDIYFAVRDSSGTEIKSITKFTNGVAGDEYYDTPALTALTGNKALLVYEGPDCFSYAVLDSMGNTVKGEVTTGECGGMVDAVQFSDGNTIIVWSGFSGVEHIILDSAYNLIAGPTLLNNPAALYGDEFVSVSADQAGHAILTWLDDDWDYRHHLYYALVNSDGSLLTQPMIFHTAGISPWGGRFIQTSYEGYGNTSYTIQPHSNGVDNYVHSNDIVGTAPGGVAPVPIAFGNNGLTSATSVVVTATLDISTTYGGDTSGITPAQIGNTLHWNLPVNLDFLGGGEFTIFVNTPPVTIGTRFPLALEIGAAEMDANLTDNTTQLDVMVSRHNFLPLSTR